MMDCIQYPRREGGRASQRRKSQAGTTAGPALHEERQARGTRFLVHCAGSCKSCGCGAAAVIGHAELAVARALLARIEAYVERATGSRSQGTAAGVGGDGVIRGSAGNGEGGEIHRGGADVRDGDRLRRRALADRSEPKFRAVGESAIDTPVPVRVTFWGLFAALSVSCNMPVRVPLVVGVNTTTMSAIVAGEDLCAAGIG
jgi:hypothetical protein